MNDQPQGGRDLHLGVNYEGALPASGAVTNQDYTAIPATLRRVDVRATYTAAAGSTNGQARYYVEWQVDGDPASPVGSPVKGYAETFIDSASVTVGEPDGEVPQYRILVDGPQVALSISPFRHRLLSLEVPPTATGVRIIAAEKGDISHPGTVKLDLAGSFVL